MDIPSEGWSSEHCAVRDGVAAHSFERYGIDFDRRGGRTLPRLRKPLRAASLGAGLALAATPARGEAPGWDWAAANPFGLDNTTFLTLYAALVVLVAMLTWLLRDVARTSDRRPDLRDLGDVDLAYCVGGEDRAADTLYLALASRGAAKLGMDGIVVEGPVADLPPQLEGFRSALVGSRSRKRYRAAFADSPPYRAMLDRLLARKILLDHPRRARLDIASRAPATLLLAFGLAKVCVGVSRGEPVGFVLVLMALTSLAFVAAFGRERYLSREARASLDALRARSGRALRAPLPEELSFAFALLGIVALDGTAHAAYARLMKPRDDGAGAGAGCGADGGSGGGSSS